MGNTCTPEKRKADDDQPVDMENKEEEAEEAAQPTEKFTKIINTYQAENEKMRRELESMKNKDEEDNRTRNVQAAQNEEVMKELAAMKAMMEEKDRALVKHQLEAALHSKATSLGTAETVTKLLQSGTIGKFGRGRKSKAKDKWVEIHIHCAQTTDDGVTKGLLMLTYADNKGAQLSNRCQVIAVKQDGSNVGAKTKGGVFSLEVISSGAEKELLFSCEDEKTKEEWVRACTDGLTVIEEEFSTLKTAREYALIDVEFSKPKLGIRVEEKVIATEEEAKVAEAVDKAEDNEEVKDKENALKTVEQVEKPCELVVKMINDESLLTSGLTVECVVSAINGRNLRGLTYSKQVGIFSSTKKPFIITFMKKKSVQVTAFPGVLKELVADGDNAVKSAFYDLVKGTQFGMELDKSENKVATITDLLSNQRRLTAVLQNTTIQEAEL